MAISLDKLHVTAEDGTHVTGDMVREWVAAYERGELPDGYRAGKPHVGRPRMVDGEMDTLTVRIPKAQKDAIKREAAERGMSTSGYVREVLAMRSA